MGHPTTFNLTGNRPCEPTPLIEENPMINQQALERLKAATFDARVVGKVLEQMDSIGSVFAGGDIDLPIDYQQAGDDVEAGEMIPVITIGLRQVNIIDKEVSK
jgi:hypothetical protein